MAKKTESKKTTVPEPDEPSAAYEPAEEPAAATDSTKNIPASAKASWHRRLASWYLSHKKLSIPLSILLVVVIVGLIPWTRYHSLGLVLKKNFIVKVVDSKTGSPVSGAKVSYNSLSAQTDGNGEALLKAAKVGPHNLSVSKNYYKDQQANIVVPIFSQKSKPQIGLEATGRQVKINIANIITKKDLSGVDIKIAGITAQTDSSGNATVVLPPGVAEQKASLSLKGYNSVDVKVKVSDQKIEENKFTLTPAGKIYFLSKRTGKIDLMKSNLDGTEQAVVVAGTGSEDQSDTILLASRDWKYLAFKSKRDGDKPKVYWIDTSVDKLNVLDEGDASFTMIGWASNNFIYKVIRNSVADWQPNREAIKSFNATTAKLAVLNQTEGVGTGATNFAYESFYYSQYIIDSTLVFSKTWQKYYNVDPTLTVGKQAGIYSINADGSGFKTLKNFPNEGSSYVYINSVLYEPKEIYYDVYMNSADTFYRYKNGVVSQDDGIKDAYQRFVSTSYPTYLLSPSAKQTFWVELRDGRSSILLGNSDGGDEKEVAKLSDEYQNYGYYTDEYLLVSKKSSELYIMPSSGVKSESDLLKITDYHKPAYKFYGYGGGYGGL